MIARGTVADQRLAPETPEQHAERLRQLAAKMEAHRLAVQRRRAATIAAAAAFRAQYAPRQAADGVDSEALPEDAPNSDPPIYVRGTPEYRTEWLRIVAARQQVKRERARLVNQARRAGRGRTAPPDQAEAE